MTEQPNIFHREPEQPRAAPPPPERSCGGHAPPFRSSDPWAWAEHHVRCNMKVYLRFERLAEDWRRRFRRGTTEPYIGSRMLIETLRYRTSLRTGVELKISNNLQQLWARLYLAEHPAANLGTKTSRVWDRPEDRARWRDLVALHLREKFTKRTRSKP